MRLRRVLLVSGSVLAFGALLAGGCWVEVGPWHHHAGYAVMRWTIDGQADASACVQRDAQQVEIRAIDAWGDLSAVSVSRCDAFEETFLLDEGWYHAELAMRDTVGHALSSSVTTGTFHVAHHESVLVTVDFPGCTVVPLAPQSCTSGSLVENRDGAGCVISYACALAGPGR